MRLLQFLKEEWDVLRPKRERVIIPPWSPPKPATPAAPAQPLPNTSAATAPAPEVIPQAQETIPMSVVTHDIRAAGFGGVLDDIEAAEKAVAALVAPGGLTPENVEAAAAAAAKATSSATSAVVTVEQNPVAEGAVLVTDAVSFLGPIIVSSLTKKAGTTGTVSVSELGSLVTEVQTLIGKL